MEKTAIPPSIASDDKEKSKNVQPSAAQKPSYDVVAKGNRDMEHGWSLHYVKPKDPKVIFFTMDQWKVGSFIWKNTLVGYVIGRKPTFAEMNPFTHYQWKEGAVSKLSMLGNGVCLFSFHDEESKEAILEKRWTFFGYPLILRPWTAEMDLENLSVTKMPVWVRFPRLHLNFWNPEAITMISSFLGTPLATDKFTAKRVGLDYARVLIDIEVMKELTVHVPIEIEGCEMYQPMEFEWKHVKCSRCSKFGHSVGECKTKIRKIGCLESKADHILYQQQKMLALVML